ncbi:UDP-3-O-acyl-N-acetylglucosamine deacetylase [Marinicella pacifica]|jgi:UDP-3-O-[3-hydroxymyristoyl] N-acetylglucosamine deacetylase|uniref:UDP-3-O-acyl-N-acetylglucosamine deacetylase n=1 Tax=Marinicella pacifica TaxID=1171543 RepID=A0A917FTH8_9GAMM|nr:UDP-3-O-acyl-N-acetylglucosamine deacetylase [Marinicella pacifica]GGG00395.1 UDP-3-O-acyl-N-acetylglucosamine deacetylase [Marinicella pacifica]
MIAQQTLKNTVRATGVGIHSGQKVFITLQPAPVNTGIVFRRVDYKQPVTIASNALNVGETSMSTTLVKNGVKVGTVEHLMAAFAGMNIDNCYVDLSASEVPVMDGSSGPFVFLIQSAGIREQDAPRRFIKIKKEVKITVDDKYAVLKPGSGSHYSFEIEFDHPAFEDHCRYAEIDLNSQSFVKEVSRARTFGFMRDIETLRSHNLGLGGSMDNAIVLDDYRVLNNDGLRYESEFVKHKLLDAIGDIYQLGHPIIGQFHGYKSGHALNNELARALLADESAYEIVTFEGKKDRPAAMLPAYLTV